MVSGFQMSNSKDGVVLFLMKMNEDSPSSVGQASIMGRQITARQALDLWLTFQSWRYAWYVYLGHHFKM